MPLLRRVDFPGKLRLRRWLTVPQTGEVTAGFPGGIRLALDVGEQVQRDHYFGIYDRVELALVRRLLAGGGDAVDVGAHIGFYAIAAARTLRGRGRVLALEPNPVSRQRLLRNLALNGCDNVTVVERPASAAPGRDRLFAPAGGDAAWWTLERDRFRDSEPIEVEKTTVDREVQALGLDPALVKIDVEGHEPAVLRGMSATLERRPAVICEIALETREAIEGEFAARDYTGFRIERRGLVAGLSGLRLRSRGIAPLGVFNALFVPSERLEKLGLSARSHTL